MKTRTRRAGGGLAAELAGLANPAPVSTELPDDDFDPTGGAVARAADREDATSSDDSDADANAFGDDDEGVFEPTKADRATVGKGKLRMRAGIAIDDGEYVGKSSSRAAMEGAWAGEEDERDESDESDDASDDHAVVTDSDDKSDSDETNDDDDDDGESEEASEEETPEEDALLSDSESQSESDSDGEGAFHETSAANALEAELAAMRAEEAEANRLLKTKSQNVAKGAAVRTQNACWERSLRTRIVLQKGLTLAAKMPAPEYAKAMRDADAEVAPALAVAAASARGALDALLRLQAALMDGNPAIGEALREGENDGNDGAGNAKKRKTRGFYAEAATLDLLSKPAAAVWRAADAAFQSYAPFRDQSCDRWHRKAQVTSGKTGSVGSNPGGRGENLGALRAFDQSLSQQVRAAMRPPDRLVNRSRPPAHLAPRRLGEPEVSLERKEKNHDEDGFDDDVALLTADARADDRVAEVYEDADFYEQALKEFLETRGAGSNLGAAGVPAASQPPKRRKQVDRRASKGRKLRYHVQQPLVNFCAPVELEVPGWAEKVFTRLFASSA